MRIANRHYLIIDLEATCSDDGQVPREEMEIIEIGAVMQNAKTFAVESEFQTFIMPVRHPTLTAFCTGLTGIQQADLAGAPPFAWAIEELKNWMFAFDDCLFCSWGDYDRNQLMQDCNFHRIGYPFAPAHLNLKAAFSETLGLKKRFGLDGALRKLGLDFEGSHHRGLDDARNIARIVRRLCGGQ